LPKNKDMAKRYSKAEKEALLAAFASSGQRLAAFSRSCGVSAITLRSWLMVGEATTSGGFEPIVPTSIDSQCGFRMLIGGVQVECGSLPTAEWVSELIKRLSV
jgi:transposase-like protein